MLRTFSTRMMLKLSTRLPASNAAKQFAAREDGAMAVIGVFIFVMIMFAGGLAIDLMRSEVDRANLQSTIDRATLAAASVGEQDEASIVLRNYLAAAGLPEDAAQIDSFVSDNQGKSVTFTATSEVDSLFIGMLGQDSLVQPISASGNQEYSEVEVSIVLDISGSMGGAKITSLKREANTFVRDLLRDRESLTSISIVPYNSLVNIGPTLAKYVPMSQEHQLSYCVTFPLAHFKTTQIAPVGQPQVMERMPYFDWRTGNSNEPGLVPVPHCLSDTQISIYTPEDFPNDRGQVVAWSNDVTELQGAINSLKTGEFTATDLGAKVGAYLLDPSAQSVVSKMIDDGLVDEAFRGRPLDWGTPGSTKVLVIMTDGSNTEQWNIHEDRRRGPSGVFVYREPDANGDGEQDPGYRPIVLIPDGVDDTNEDGERIYTCDPIEAETILPGEEFPTLTLLPHDNCDGRKGRFDPNAPAAGDPADPWWLYPRIDAIADQVDGTYTTGLRFSFRSRHSAANRAGFYVPHLHVEGASLSDYYLDEPMGGTEAYELSYTELFAFFTPDYIGDTLAANTSARRADWTTRSHYRNADTRTHHRGTKISTGETLADQALLDLCEAATDNQRQIAVFTIAFAAGSHAERVMRDCAKKGTTGTFYPVQNITGSDTAAPDGGLAQAFSDILASIEELRLTE